MYLTFNPDYKLMEERLSKAIPESLHVHFYAKNKKGEYVDTNDAHIKYFGLGSEDEILGLADDKLLWSKCATQYIKNDREVINKQEGRIYLEKSDFHKSEDTFLSLKSPLYALSGKVIGIFGMSILLTKDMDAEIIFENIAGIIDPFNLRSKQYKQLINGDANSNNLPKRQFECLTLLTKGYTSKEIGRELNISFRTVEYHLETLKEKFKCSKRSELIGKALTLSEIKDNLKLA